MSNQLKLKASTEPISSLNTPLLVVFLKASASSSEQLPAKLAAVDEAFNGAISRAISRRDFRADRDETFFITGPDSGVQRVLLAGLGKNDNSRVAFKRAGALAARKANAIGVAGLHAYALDIENPCLEGLIAGLSLGAWYYDDLKTAAPLSERRDRLQTADIIISDNDSAKEAFRVGGAIANGQSLARTLGMMPGNVCTPETFVITAQSIAERHKNVNVKVLGEAEMREAGMGAFLSVAQGIPQEPRLVAVEYNGGKAGDAPIVLVGKGLCFDTGGISIKPAGDMEWMKYDMSGAGGVMGAMEAIATIAPPVNVVGIIGSTTNMPSGTAVKPGDVVRASNGKTIEVINTDAEGRLVLADLLVWASRYNPSVVLDAATLTGAIVIALGHRAVGLFGTDSALVEEVRAAGEACGEPGWPLPVWDEYADQIRSDVADLKNTGGRAAGSITAALFLKEFVDGYPWVHLDVAGTAYSQSDLGWLSRGPTGIPVGTFVEFVRGRSG